MVVLGEVQEVVVHVELRQLGLAEGIRVGRAQRSRQKVCHLQQTPAARQAQAVHASKLVAGSTAAKCRAGAQGERSTGTSRPILRPTGKAAVSGRHRVCALCGGQLTACCRGSASRIPRVSAMCCSTVAWPMLLLTIRSSTSTCQMLQRPAAEPTVRPCAET